MADFPKTMLGYEYIGWDCKPSCYVGNGRLQFYLCEPSKGHPLDNIHFPSIFPLCQHYGERTSIYFNGSKLECETHGFIRDTNVRYTKKETDAYLVETYAFGLLDEDLLHAIVAVIVIKNKDLFGSSYPDLPSEPDSWTEPETEEEAQQHLVPENPPYGHWEVSNTTDSIKGNYALMFTMTDTYGNGTLYFNEDHSPIDLTHYNRISFKWKWEGVSSSNRVILSVGGKVVYSKDTPNTDGYEEVVLDISDVEDRSSISGIYIQVGYGGSGTTGSTCKIDDLKIYSTANYEIELRTPTPPIWEIDTAQCEYDESNDVLKMYDASENYPYEVGAWKNKKWKVLWLVGFNIPSTGHRIQGVWGKNSYDSPSQIGNDIIRTETGEMAADEVKKIVLYNIMAPYYEDGTDDAYITLSKLKSYTPDQLLEKAISQWRNYVNSGVRMVLHEYPQITELINQIICELRASLDPLHGTHAVDGGYAGVNWYDDLAWAHAAMSYFMHHELLEEASLYTVKPFYENCKKYGESPWKHMVTWNNRVGGAYFAFSFRVFMMCYQVWLNTKGIDLQMLEEFYPIMETAINELLKLFESDPNHPIYGHLNHWRLKDIEPPVGCGEGFPFCWGDHTGSIGKSYCCSLPVDMSVTQSLKFMSYVSRLLGMEEEAQKYLGYAEIIESKFTDYLVDTYEYDSYDGTLRNIYVQLIFDDENGEKVKDGFGCLKLPKEWHQQTGEIHILSGAINEWFEETFDIDYLIEFKRSKMSVVEGELYCYTADGCLPSRSWGGLKWETSQLLNHQCYFYSGEGDHPPTGDVWIMQKLFYSAKNGFFNYFKRIMDHIETLSNVESGIFDEHADALTSKPNTYWYSTRGLGAFLLVMAEMFRWKRMDGGYLLRIIPATDFSVTFPDGTVVDVFKEGDDTKYLSSVILDGKPINTFEPQFKSALIPIKAGEKHTVKFIFSDDKPSSPSINYVDVLTKLKNVSYNSVFRVLSAELESPEIPQKIRFYVPKSLYPYKPYVEVSGAEVTYEKWDPENETLELKIVSHSPATITLYPDSITYYFLSGRMMLDLISITSLVLIKEAISSVVNAFKEGVS